MQAYYLILLTKCEEVATCCGAILAARAFVRFAVMRSRILRGAAFAGALLLSTGLLPKEAAAATTLTLTWQASASSPNIDGYRIYYGTSSGNYSQHVDVVGTATKATVANAPSGSTYYYAVVAFKSGVESTLSNEVKSSLPSATPTPTPTPSPSPTPTPTPTPTPAPPPTPTPTTTPTPTPTPTPVLSGLTYKGGTAFVNGTTLTKGKSYTVTAQANRNTKSVVFKRGTRVVKTDSATPFDFTWAPSAIGTHAFVATPWSSTGATGSRGVSITVSYKVVAAPSPTPTPTPAKMATALTPNPRPTPTAIPIVTPPPSPTPFPMPTPTAIPIVTPPPSPTATRTPTPTPTPTATANPTPTLSPASTPDATATPTPTPRKKYPRGRHRRPSPAPTPTP